MVLPAAADANNPQYVVQAGDTLYGIALRFGLTTEALLAANPGVNPDALAIGQTLIVPGFEGITGTLDTHTLEPGESLHSLALRLGLSRETLIRLNRLVNVERLYVSQAVVVVDEADAGPALSTGMTYAARPGEGLLALSAARGKNVWAVAASNRLPGPVALTPGALAAVPGPGQPIRALPYPLLELTLRPFPPEQGQTVVVRAATEQPLTLTGSLGAAELHFHGDELDSSVHFALQGIHRLADPDLYLLTVAARDASGAEYAFSQAVPVRAGDFLVDLPLTVDPETIDPAVTEPENELVRSVISVVTPDRYWTGLFALPSVGALRSVYGSLRSYNGGPYNAFHTGVDFSGGEDRPITAPAPGVVVFTGALTVRGNATIIDHGWGVYTGYWHQSSIQVQVGDRVGTGQVIGFNGATGRVTGPHLHWEMWVGGNQVDPLEWTEVVFP